MVIARVFGADASTDAFFVAFKIPNFLRRLFAEGAFAQAFVPVLTEYKESEDAPGLKGFLDRTAGNLALALAAITLAGVFAAPLIILFFAPGFSWNSTRHELAAQMLQITFPYLFFIASTAFAGGILNTFGKFAVPAFTPVFLNLCLISAAIWLAPLMPEPITALAWGVLLAGMVQLAFQFPALHRLGLLPRLRFDFQDPNVHRILSLMAPAIFAVSVTQINFLLDTLIASFLTAGSISWLYYSDRLVEFPLGLFGIALAAVILPNLSKNHAAKDNALFSHSMDWSLRWVLLIGFPATLGLLILAKPLLATLFQYNEFSPRDVLMASYSLMAYAVGLLGFFLVKILVPGFTSRQEMRTPVRFGLYAMLANMTLNIALVFPFGHAGLALATSLAAFINAALLLRKLLHDGIYKPNPGWLPFSGRILLANFAMGALLAAGVNGDAWLAWDVADRVQNIGIWISLGFGVYCACLFVSGIRLKDLGLQQVNDKTLEPSSGTHRE